MLTHTSGLFPYIKIRPLEGAGRSKFYMC